MGGQWAIATEGAVNAERSGSGLGVVEGREVELVVGVKEVGSARLTAGLCPYRNFGCVNIVLVAVCVF